MSDKDDQPDKRPRPKYGELAPEGWVWRPPADQSRLDTTHPVPSAEPSEPRYGQHSPDASARPPAPAHPDAPSDTADSNSPSAPPHGQPPQAQHPQDQYPQGPYPVGQYPQGPGHPGQHDPFPPAGHYPPPYGPPLPVPPGRRSSAPRWNLGWSIALLTVGFFGMAYSVGALNTLPAAIQLMHANQNLGDYHEAASVPGLLTGGSIAIVAIWAVSAALTIWLLVRRTLSFYVPLIAGIVALIVLVVIVSAVLTTDPVLLDFYSGVSATPTPAPS
ncbi:DUF6264 family protein [Leifsonia poae]|uniref:DUF6264 family protein n=1 Tax=Leifsonia poae TaxID=110933 RepID=UPI001CBC2CB7|nr:DUF6264 family protein [Leifsonia poae]